MAKATIDPPEGMVSEGVSTDGLVSEGTPVSPSRIFTDPNESENQAKGSLDFATETQMPIGVAENIYPMLEDEGQVKSFANVYNQTMNGSKPKNISPPKFPGQTPRDIRISRGTGARRQALQPDIATRMAKTFGRSFVNLLATIRTKSNLGMIGTDLAVIGERLRAAKDAGLMPEDGGFEEYFDIDHKVLDELFGGETIVEHWKRINNKRFVETPGFKATDIPPALTIPEKAADVVGKVAAFVTKLAITKKILGAPAAGRDIAAWEVLNQAEGGIPGAGAAMYVALRGIDKIPIEGAKGFFAKTGTQSALFAGTAAAAGGDKEAIATAALLPWALRAFDATVKTGTKLARVKLEAKAVKNLREMGEKNGIDLKNVPDSSLKYVIGKARQARFWNKQFDKGKITEQVLNDRLGQLRQDVTPVLGAIAKQQPVARDIVKAEPGVPKPTAGIEVKPPAVARKAPVKPPVGPPPPVTIKKPGVKIQRIPDKKVPSVAMKPGFVDFGPLVDAGPQVKQVSEKASKLVRRFGGLDSEVRKVFIEYEEQLRELPKVVAKDSVEKFGHLSPEEEILIQQHREQPKKFPDLPDDLTPTLKVLESGIEEYGRRLEELGYSADWPNQYLNRLEKKLEKELNKDEVDALKVANLEAAIEEGQDLQYLHHFYEALPLGKRIIGRFKRSISKRPKGVLGRKIPTLEKAKELGLTPAPLAVSYAHMAHEVARAELANDLITAVNLNPELSLPEDLAPQEWVRLDERIFPAGVQHLAFVNEEGKPVHLKKFKKYPIPIAEALEEIAWTRNFSALEKVYDKLNFGMKIVGFYNPFVMLKNDAFQLWRATGIKGAVPLLLPQMEGGINTLQPPKAIQIWAEKGAEYEKLRKGGLFNNIVSYTPVVTEVTQSMLNHIRETDGEQAARIAKEWLNPVNIPKNLRRMNDASTWNMDEIMRIAAYEAVKNQPMLEGMTDFEKIEWVNDAMVNYGSIPKETKRWINKAMFTPSYRIGNFSYFWRNIAHHPWRMKGPLLRTVGYKMFIRWGLPAIVSAAIAYKINEDRDVRTEKGYKLVIHNPDTGGDTVYSLSDPLLEGVKVTQRPFTDTIGLNLAPVPSLVVRLLGGPKRKNTDDPFGEFFKLGTPVWRDIVNWKDPDKTVPQKLLTQFAIAYVYTRRGREADKENVVEAMAKTLAIWTDWKEQSAKAKQIISGRNYYLGPGGKFGRLIREFNMEQDIDRDEVDARLDSMLNAGKYKEAIKLMAETERYETTEGVSGRILKHREPIAYYWQVMSSSDKKEFIQWLHDNKLYSSSEIAELGEALEKAKRP